MAEERSAEKLVVDSTPGVDAGRAEEELAATSPSALRHRLTLRPESSSEEVYPEDSESTAGGGVAGRLRMEDLAVRFLNREGAVVAAAEDAMSVMTKR